MVVPFFATKAYYQDIVKNDAYTNPTPSYVEDLDPITISMWATDSTLSMDYLEIVFPLDYALLEVMLGHKRLWDYLYNQSYFILKFHRVENGEICLTMLENKSWPMNPLVSPSIYIGGNRVNIF